MSKVTETLARRKWEKISAEQLAEVFALLCKGRL